MKEKLKPKGQTPPTCCVGDHKGTLFRDGENPVYVLDDGRFAVKWGGVWKTAKTLSGIDSVVRKSRPVVLVFVDDSDKFPVYEAVAYVDGKLTDKNGKRHYVSWRSVYKYDQSVIDKLKAIDARIAEAESAAEAIREERVEFLNSHDSRVPSYGFKKLLEGSEPK